MTVDTVVGNGLVVAPGGIIRGGVAIEGERIVAVGPDAGLPPARRRIEADDRHHLGDVGFHLGCVDEAVDHGCLADDLDHPAARIEGSHRVLKDHLDG